MAQLHRSRAALRIDGDHLVPDEISTLLGASPTLARTKGEEIVSHKTGHVRIARTGQWHLDATPRSPEDVDDQISELLNQLTGDLGIWKSLSVKYKIDLFCGWFMEEGDEGLEISAGNLTALGVRGIKLGVCLYAPIADQDDPSPPSSKTADN